MDKWYSLTEISGILRITRQTASKLIRNGKLKAINVSSGKRPEWRIHDTHYLQFISEGLQENMKGKTKNETHN